MRGLFLILKNSFKNVFKNKFQIFGLTLLVALLALIVSLMASINARVVESYSSLKSASNAHNVVLQMDPFDEVPTAQSTGDENIPENRVEAQQFWLYELQNQYYREQNNLQFEWSRTEAREFSQVFVDKTSLTVKTIAKVTPQNVYNQQPVDSLVVFEGHQIRSDRQVVIDPIFAKQNNVKIGAIIRIQNDNFGNQLLVSSTNNPKLVQDIQEMQKNGLEDPNGVYQQEYSKNYDWYQVVGFGGSADFMMPVLNASSVLPNRKTELLVYVDPTPFGLVLATDKPGARKGIYEYNPNTDNGRKLIVSSNNEWESFYSLKMLDNHIPSSGEIKKMNEDFNQILKKLVNPKTFFYSSMDSNYRFASRTLTINQTMVAYNISTSILEILFAVIVLYSVGLVTRKQIEKVQGQIGTLKSLGYAKKELVLNFVMMPFFTAFLGGIIGFAIAGGLSNVLVDVFADYFLLNYGAAKFDWLGFFGAILILWAILTGLAFLITFVILKKKDTLTLINARQITRASRYGDSFKQKKANAKIGAKISSALLADATGKMSVVGIVVLIATMIFTISFAAPDILRRNQVASYTGVKYKQIVEYSEPIYNNPLTFYKTYNSEATAVDPVDPNHIFKFSKEEYLNGFTSLPLNNVVNNVGEGYNVNRIMSDYHQNNINNEMFSLFMNNKGSVENPVPELVLANMRFLQGKDLASSTDYYRFMSSYGMPGGGFFDDILLSQWPDYNELIANLVDEKQDAVTNFNVLQNFYAKYVNSIGLSITNTYYNYGHGEGQVGPEASDDAKIKSFNESDDGKSNPQTILTKTQTEQDQHFNSYLKSLQIEPSVPQFKFNFTDSTSQLGTFHITDGVHNGQDELNDYFLGLSGRELWNQDRKEFENTLIKFILWFGSLFSNRGDEGIIQAAYFRSPYFTQQYFKQAYQAKKPYVQSFAVISYNDQLEQLGTKLRVKSKKDQEFKIYGIQETATKFLDLKNKNSDNLIIDLYRDQSKNGIIINQSLAKILKIGAGSTVSLKVLQDELRGKEHDLNQAFNLGDWDILEPRKFSQDEAKNGFTQLHKLDNTAALKMGDGEKLSINPNPLLANDPSDLYKNVLQGNLINANLETETTFKVLGVHDGYGVPQAWIKETDAQKILKYDEVKKFMWNQWFVYQWGNEFTTDHLDPETGFKFDKIESLDFSKNRPTYDEFVLQYLVNADSKTKRSARIIMKIFSNSFPIFNYKYSNKDDVGDLKNLVSIHQKFGDYSPIGMQGISADGRNIKKTYEGAGQGAIGAVVPVEISKAILAKISNLVMLILILAILAILLITFVIIFLTTALIIDDNVKFISTMKVLGYSNRYIASKVLGMYFIVIGTVFVVGFIAGWFIFAAIVQTLVPTIVLPLKFQVWLPFVVLMGVVGIYLIAILVGFHSISKTNAVAVLQNNDL